MGQVSRKLKKYILGIALGIALMCGKESYAQYNREYFFWVGRSCMMNNDYQEAIRTLNDEGQDAVYGCHSVLSDYGDKWHCAHPSYRQSHALYHPLPV